MVSVGNAFTAEQLDAIEKLGNESVAGNATIDGAQTDVPVAKLRVTQVAWIDQKPGSQWLYDRMNAVVGDLNARFYQFDLTGYSDPFQYTIYHGREGGHYDWHVDQIGARAPRKLSIPLQLSDPAAYEGGDLQLHGRTEIDNAPRARGTLVAFPSWVLHRVTPVTSGTRRSLVAWTMGPKFR